MRDARRLPQAVHHLTRGLWRGGSRAALMGVNVDAIHAP
jgi:hypothetical protein